MQARKARLDFERDLRFGWDMWAWARLQVQSWRSRAYFYYFKQKPPFPKGSIHEDWGASHFAELWYVFDHLDQNAWRWAAADRRLARQMSAYWTNFVKGGDPNGDGLLSARHFDGGDAVLHLSDSIVVDGLPNRDRLLVFDAKSATDCNRLRPRNQEGSENGSARHLLYISESFGAC